MNNSRSEQSPKPVCQHQPGDVWADGCCTSRATNSENTIVNTNESQDVAQK